MKSDQATETISMDSLLELLQMQQVMIDEKDRQIEDLQRRLDSLLRQRYAASTEKLHPDPPLCG